jgi:hypothetical protein
MRAVAVSKPEITVGRRGAGAFACEPIFQAKRRFFLRVKVLAQLF